jgi:hypothetical protein
MTERHSSGGGLATYRARAYSTAVFLPIVHFRETSTPWPSVRLSQYAGYGIYRH